MGNESLVYQSDQLASTVKINAATGAFPNLLKNFFSLSHKNIKSNENSVKVRKIRTKKK